MTNLYKKIKLLGNGKFGHVYLAEHLRNKQKVALKIESELLEFSLIKQEAKILFYLHQQSNPYVPTIFWYGKIENSLSLAMTYYEQSYEGYLLSPEFKENRAIMSLFYFNKMIDILESIHSEFLLHRDIKPENFMMKNHVLFLIDFGLSRFFIDDQENHILNVKGNHLLGTPKYISPFVHNGETPSRRDDIISCVYLYLYSKNGTLPWENMQFLSEKSTNSSITEIDSTENKLRLEEKLNIDRFPEEKHLLKICYEMRFEEKPKYQQIKESLN